jgi:hypothetical protein
MANALRQIKLATDAYRAILMNRIAVSVIFSIRLVSLAA